MPSLKSLLCSALLLSSQHLWAQDNNAQSHWYYDADFGYNHIKIYSWQKKSNFLAFYSSGYNIKIGYAWSTPNGLSLGLHTGLHHNGTLNAEKHSGPYYDIHYKNFYLGLKPQYSAQTIPINLAVLMNLSYGQMSVRDPRQSQHKNLMQRHHALGASLGSELVWAASNNFALKLGYLFSINHDIKNSQNQKLMVLESHSPYVGMNLTL
jgi:hypothetical protein